MEVRPATDDDVDGCVAVLADLPDWFTPSTHADLRVDLAAGQGWVAVDGDAVVGFVAATRRFPGAAELTFVAVLPERHRRGVGTALVERSVAGSGAEEVGDGGDAPTYGPRSRS